MLRFVFVPAPELPRLSWCARLSRGGETVVVEHGSGVETTPAFFVEGAWDGRFGDGEPATATTMLGSGGQIMGDGACFCTTTHSKERLQSLLADNALLISNSFTYLLRAAGDAVDPNYRFYERDFMSSMNGISRACKRVPTAGGLWVRLHYSERIYVDRSLRMRTERYPEPRGFASYEDYVEGVETLLRALTDNATAPARRTRYRPLATISTGYDSPAAAVFAQHVGCTEAITFCDARAEYADVRWNPADADDSGADIARHIGIAVKTYSRGDYRRCTFPEAEFLATGNGGDDVILRAAESEFSGSMLYTGFLGDIVWDCQSDRTELSRDYAYKDPSGASLGEFRLRVGFIHVPVPLLHFTRHRDLDVISRSDEMARWRVGGDYDRPIPRRLVESRGVPRHLYGQNKKAITQPIWLPADFRDVLLPESYADLVAYWRRTAAAAGLSLQTRLRQRVSPLLTARCLPLVNRCKRTLNWQAVRVERLTGRRLLPPLNTTTPQTAASVLYGTPAGVKFHWAIDKVLPRYAATRLAPAAQAEHAA